jgi:hypothetical protein
MSTDAPEHHRVCGVTSQPNLSELALDRQRQT